MSPYSPSDIRKSKQAGKQGTKSHSFFKVMSFPFQGVWIMAAKWEFEENASIDNARYVTA